MLISDSLYCVEGLPHPRLYGSFPRFLQEYCLCRPVLRMEQAIAKMTSLPARRAGLAGRGEIKPGAWADLVLFDPAPCPKEWGGFQPILCGLGRCWERFPRRCSNRRLRISAACALADFHRYSPPHLVSC